MLAVETEALTKVFSSRGRTVQAVRGITFSVERGERLAYIGPNGAGKSTSIKILTGILHPTSGDATVLGLIPWRRRRELAIHHVEAGGLAGAVRADEGEELALAHREADVVDGAHAAEGLS